MSCKKFCLGDLRHEITIQEETQAADGFGGQTVTWVEFAQTKAAVRYRSGLETFHDQKLESRETYTFTVRYIDGVKESMMVVDDKGVEYNIKSIENHDFRDEWLSLIATKNVVM